MIWHRRWITLIVVLCSTQSIFANMKLPAIFSDNMVIQRESEVAIWGWASEGTPIMVRPGWSSETYRAETDESGKWMVFVKTPAAGGPYNINILGTHAISLRNVLVGEVWVCSGQSNMEMLLRDDGRSFPVDNATAEIAAANYPNIRFFTVPRTIATKRSADVKGEWKTCSPETVMDLSAVAYFFGRELTKRLDVPIGLIHTSWGGTPAEAWTRRQALEELGGYSTQLAEFDRALEPEAVTEYQEQYLAWTEAHARLSRAELTAENPATVEYDDSNWKTMHIPAVWESVDDAMNIDGVVWFRKSLTLPDGFSGTDLTLHLGPIDDYDHTYFNGVEVGNMPLGTRDHWSTPRIYSIPADLVRPGENVLSVRVYDTGGYGGLYGETNQFKLVRGSGSGARELPLSGEWLYYVEEELPRRPTGAINSHSPSVLYNGMIHPIIPYGLRGVIWYQGESNAARPREYRSLFPAMIKNWRSDWCRDEFPFYFVQIAPFRYGDQIRSQELREAQMMTMSLENTGMVVTMDIGDNEDIHPSNKQDVGKRLAKWALNKTYGVSEEAYSGPIYKSMAVEGHKIRLQFDFAMSGLKAAGQLSQFEIAGADRVFRPAKATIDSTSLVVFSKEVPEPVAVRYAWRNTTIAELFNGDGLPASSFRTDDW